MATKKKKDLFNAAMKILKQWPKHCQTRDFLKILPKHDGLCMLVIEVVLFVSS